MSKLWLCDKCGEAFPWAYWGYDEVIIVGPDGDPDESRPWECPKCEWRFYSEPNRGLGDKR